MFKFVLLGALALISSCSAVPYGYGQPQLRQQTYQQTYQARPLSTYARSQSTYQPTSYAESSYTPNNNYGLLTLRQGQTFEPTVSAAIQQLGRTVEYRPLAYQEAPIQAQVIEIEPSDNPGSPALQDPLLDASHSPAVPQQYETKKEVDEPQRLAIEVQRPAIQEVREIISPYRQLEQQINPVQESLHTVVTKGEGQRAQYSAPSYGGSQYSSNAYAQPAAAPLQTSYSKQQTTTQYKPLPAASLQTNNYPAEPAAVADSPY
ncbi:hypothetical protein TYRP_009123 [Tyrophagus putrescentiae]|nr:hypothetical protein TYRP_009123 [Tyrophagus putrescentiae]